MHFVHKRKIILIVYWLNVIISVRKRLKTVVLYTDFFDTDVPLYKNIYIHDADCNNTTYYG